jgi:hypothetical protein
MNVKFAGKWELESSSSFPFSYNYLPPGNGNIIILGKDRNFERKKSDTLVFKGSFSIKFKPDCYPNGENALFFETSEPNSTGMYISIKADKLTLSTSNCLQDGGISIFRKLD